MNSPAPRRVTATAAMVVAAMLMGATLVSAGHFGDVNPSSVHAPGIEYVADAGITEGCRPGEFCPRDDLTRDQMATFIHRMSGNAPGIDPSVNAHRLEGFSAAELMAGGGEQGPQGPEGPEGPAGPPGPAGVAGLEIVTESGAVDGVSAHQIEVTCPAGKVVVGGGGNVTPASLNWAMERSYPNTAASWRVLWRQLPGGPAAHNATAYAICANAN